MKLIKTKKIFQKCFIITFIFSLISCQKTKIETDFFSIYFNKKYHLKLQKISSNEGYIFFNTDTLKYKRGFILNNLSEPCPKIIYMPPIKNDTFVPPNDFILSQRKDYDLDDYRKQNVHYAQIANRLCKITIPRREEGITGLYIDSLYNWSSFDLSGVARFHIYGDVSKEYRDEIIEGFKSIKFKE